MITIPSGSVAIIQAKEDHYKKIAPLLLDRLDDYVVQASLERYKELIERQLHNIVSGHPANLERLSRKTNRQFIANPGLRELIEYVFNYDWFITKKVTIYDGYDLAESLGVNVCVYCNRNYTHTVITQNREKITRPQFDHFFNKSTHPLLALSFFNLVPSCSICNSGIKHAADFTMEHHHHPYIDEFLSDFSFTYSYNTETKNGLMIHLDGGSIKTRRTLADMKTEIVYNTHTEDLSDLLTMRYKFSDNYLTILEENLLNGVSLNKNEIYRLAFGAELQDMNFGKRPLSKFKSDILKELGIIT